MLFLMQYGLYILAVTVCCALYVGSYKHSAGDWRGWSCHGVPSAAEFDPCRDYQASVY